ncbi:hypothetical protein [Salinigranum halophilum]|jgi:hypothetical protein|uniref:hypothetical protein n=1 Tax=Salinigranum halophilum TaxID=2565931 RepID=UPI00115F0E1A|nr:hypothetical protein [Salinigranum halophilum]
MQRRAAAIYVAFFLVVGAASYSLIATAEEPTIGFENPEHALEQGDEFTIDGQQYTATTVNTEVEEESSDHGGTTVTVTRTAAFAWTNQSALYTETWDNGSTVTYENDEWDVVIPNASDPTSATLRESIDRAGILANDTNADNETVTRDGQEFVIITENNSSTLVPASEYFPTPETQQLSESQTLDYNGNQTRVDVATDAVTLSWNAPQENTVEVGDQANVTLSGQTYLAFFQTNDTVVLTQDFESYRAQNDDIDQFTEQKNGLWGVTILSGLCIVFLIGLAFLPSRY